MSNGGRPRPVRWLDTVNASPLEVAAGGLLAIGVALVAMVWGAGVVSSWLVNGEAASIGLNEAGLALVHLGQNGLSWEGTWEPSVEAQLAGPGWFWLVFGIEAVLVAVLFWPVWRFLGPRPVVPDPTPVVITSAPVVHRRAARRGAGRDGDEATSDEGDGGYVAPMTGEGGIDKLLVDAPDGWRLVLGRVNGALVATENQQSVIAFGPAQSGKTSGLTAPALLDWRGPVLVATAKADVLRLTWDQRADLGGTTWLFDPTLAVAGDHNGERPGPRRRPSSWSPLHLIESVPRPRDELDVWRRQQQWTLALRTARWMVGATRPPTATGGEDRSLVVAEQMLAPLLFAAAADELPIGRVAEWISHRESDVVSLALDRTGVDEAIATWEASHGHDPATTAASLQTLSVVMYPYSDPMVGAQAEDPEISAAKLLNGKANTLYIVAPPNHQARLRPVFATLIAEMVDEAMSKASSVGRLDPPLLVVADDVGACLPPAVLDQLASVGASLGIQLLTLFQDLSQVERAFGGPQTVQLANNHRARMALPGIGDGPTLNYMDSLVRGTPLGSDSGEGGNGAGWLRTLDDGDAVCVYGNLPPIRMRLRRWFDDAGLRDRVEPPPEPTGRFRRKRRDDDQPTDGPYVPDPFDSAANDRAATRYWDQALRDGTISE